MVEGDTITGVIMDDIGQWTLAWDDNVNPAHTVLLQPPVTSDYDEDSEIGRQVACLQKFFATSDPKVPSMLYVDEGMDFFGPTGNAKYGTIIQRFYRAGRERNIVTLMATQRPSCITVQAMSESNVKYVFALGAEGDFDALKKKGIPKGLVPVDENYVFRLVRDRRLYPNPLTLKVA